MMLVAEGYALCCNAISEWAAWSFSRPRGRGWGRSGIVGRDGLEIRAWVGVEHGTKEAAIAHIQRSIEIARRRPLSEEAERARLMPV